MRSIMLLLLLLVAVASIAARIEPTQPSAGAGSISAIDMGWVRTAQGWERPASWRKPRMANHSLHPIVVAAWIALASTWALVGYPPRNRRPPQAAHR